MQRESGARKCHETRKNKGHPQRERGPVESWRGREGEIESALENGYWRREETSVSASPGAAQLARVGGSLPSCLDV